MQTLIVCLNCGSSFSIPEEFVPDGRFPCAECLVGQYTRLCAS